VKNTSVSGSWFKKQTHPYDVAINQSYFEYCVEMHFATVGLALGSLLISAVFSATVTLPIVENPLAVSPSEYSIYDTLSVAGVKSDGSETTYSEEFRISQQILFPTQTGSDATGYTVTALSTTQTVHATRVVDSDGYWYSYEVHDTISGSITLTGYLYQSCSFDSNTESGNCVQQADFGGFAFTTSWTGSLSEAVWIDVGSSTSQGGQGGDNDNSNGSSLILSSGLTQLGVVASAMILGVMLVLPL
ncbi:hypothetical protein MPER_06458, partial [Moniliophthora perniciosa FA553]